MLSICTRLISNTATSLPQGIRTLPQIVRGLSSLSRVLKKDSSTSDSLNDRKVIRHESGLLTLKGALSPEEQIQLANIAMARGKDPQSGFWISHADGKQTLNSTPHRGRIFDAVQTFPTVVSDLFQRSVAQASGLDPMIVSKEATHAIVLHYQTLETPPKEGYIPWHRDNGENDGDESYPVISFSLGDTADFLVSHQKPKLSPQHTLADPQNLGHRIRMDSGDVVIFGGPCRYVWHSIYQIYAKTAPAFLPFSGARVNFTFRHTPKLLGDERRFATKPAHELAKDNQFFKTSEMR